MTSPFLDPEVEARRAERAKEYGVWEAAGVVEFGGARAFNEGDPVPTSTVERLKLDELGLVRKQGGGDTAAATDEAKAATRTKGGSK